jgi:hypothetical protein
MFTSNELSWNDSKDRACLAGRSISLKVQEDGERIRLTGRPPPIRRVVEWLDSSSSRDELVSPGKMEVQTAAPLGKLTDEMR